MTVYVRRLLSRAKSMYLLRSSDVCDWEQMMWLVTADMIEIQRIRLNHVLVGRKRGVRDVIIDMAAQDINTCQVCW